MSIYIPGLRLPNNTEGCEVIIRIQPDGEVLDIHGIHLGLKAIEVNGHGRLIDADALEEGFIEYDAWGFSCESIEKAPTIIPADNEIK